MIATETETLGDVAKFIRGITFSPEDVTLPFEQGTAVCMRTKNVQSDLDESDLIAVPTAFVRRKEQYISEGDLLVSSANSWNLVGKCCWVPHLNYKATAGGFISILRADRSRVSPRYLYHWFAAPSVQHKVRLCGRQTTNISNLNYERCLNLPIPLPPMEEQKRIAAILDKADAIQRQRQEARNLAGQLIPSLFVEMFGDPNSNPKNWNLIKISQFVNDFEGGKNILADDVASPETRHFVLKVSAVTWNEFNPNEAKPIPPSIDSPDSYFVKPGDLLISRANTAQLVGAAVYVFETPNNLVLPDKLWRVNLKKPRMANLLFLRFLLGHPAVRAEFSKRATGTSGSMKNISKAKMMAMEVPLPPVDLQDKFADVVIANRKLEQNYAGAIADAKSLFNSLVQRAFRGEL